MLIVWITFRCARRAFGYYMGNSLWFMSLYPQSEEGSSMKLIRRLRTFRSQTTSHRFSLGNRTMFCTSGFSKHPIPITFSVFLSAIIIDDVKYNITSHCCCIDLIFQNVICIDVMQRIENKLWKALLYELWCVR